jgi:hypothetical protein
MKISHLALAAGMAACVMSPAEARRRPAAALPTPPDICTMPSQPTAPVAPAADGAAAPTPDRISSSNVMLSGAEVRMLTRTELNSQASRLGDRFELTVACDVIHNGQTVIPAGSVATGEVTRVRKKGGWGRSGILETRLISVRAGDRQYRLRGIAGDRGRAGTAAVVGAVLLSPLIVAPFMGFFVTGTSAVVPPNSFTVGYTEEDVALNGTSPVQPAVATASASEAPAGAAATATEGTPQN